MRQKGFTLVEVLVVLILLSLLTGVIFQGFSTVLRMRVGLLREVEQQRGGALYSSWLHALLSSTVPVREVENGVFLGQSQMISGVSAGTLAAVVGCPVFFTLQFTTNNDELQLAYEDQFTGNYLFGSWPESTGTFSYTVGGQLYSQWPPKTILKTFQQLPETVVVEVENEAGQQRWIVAIPGRKEPKLSVYDEFK